MEWRALIAVVERRNLHIVKYDQRLVHPGDERVFEPDRDNCALILIEVGEEHVHLALIRGIGVRVPDPGARPTRPDLALPLMAGANQAVDEVSVVIAIVHSRSMAGIPPTGRDRHECALGVRRSKPWQCEPVGHTAVVEAVAGQSRSGPGELLAIGLAVLAYAVFHVRWAGYAMYDKLRPGWRDSRVARFWAVANRWGVGVLGIFIGLVLIAGGLSRL
jgi:hypothetical protein